MKESFKLAMKPLLLHEGGKVNNPKDPGGRTNKGVTQKVYDGYRISRGLKKQTVYNMTDKEMMDIYKQQYWDPIKGDELPDGIDYCVFDAAVNSGTRQASKWMQRILNVSPIDGVVGFATLTAIKDIDDRNTENAFIDKYCNMRLSFMRSLKTWGTFGNGWTRRVADVRKISKSMVDKVPSSQVQTLISKAEATPGRALANDTKVTETPQGQEAVRSGVAAGGGLFATIISYFQEATNYVSYLTGFSPEVAQWILAGIGIMAMGTIIYFSAQAIYQVLQRRNLGERQEANL